MLLPISVSFLFINTIPLMIYNTFLSIHLLMEFWIVSSFELSEIKLLCEYLCTGYVFTSYPGVGSPGQVVSVCLIL